MIGYNIILIISLFGVIYKSNIIVSLLLRKKNLYALVMLLLVFSIISAVQHAMMIFEVISEVYISNFSNIQTRFLLDIYWSLLYFLFAIKMIIWRINNKSER